MHVAYVGYGIARVFFYKKKKHQLSVPNVSAKRMNTEHDHRGRSRDGGGSVSGPQRDTHLVTVLIAIGWSLVAVVVRGGHSEAAHQGRHHQRLQPEVCRRAKGQP